MVRSRVLLLLSLLLLVLVAAGPAAAQVAKQGHDVLSSLAFNSDKLAASEPIQSLEEAQGQSLMPSSMQNGWAAFLIGANSQWKAVVDKRSGQIALAEGGGIAWIPGRGNSLKAAAAPNLSSLDGLARGFLPRVAALLGVNPSTLVLSQGRSGQPASHVWFVDYDVVMGGLPVEGARVVFRVNNGNLVQFGTENLPAPGATVPPTKLTRDQAMAAVEGYVGKLQAGDTLIDSGSLHLVPANVTNAPFADGFQFGNGRGLAKVWQITFHRDGVMGTWQAKVDATTGELLALQDINEYAQATGGAYLNSPARGPESVRAMPFTDVAAGVFANSAGVFSSGSTSTLSGQFVRIVDTCGAISQAADGSGNIVFGTSTGTDCVTPGHGGAGNTHASRTQFYNVNRIKEVGRGWLPTNTWLGQQLRVNVNLNQTCNAYWNGSTLNFFKSGGGCANTGEIAAVSLHEYGHGLDSNDGSAANGGTGEAYGDVTAALQLHDSCIGPGFLGNNCGGYGDPCTACTGVRDIDWAKHNSNTPATVSNFTQVRCGTGGGPCGREVHCESYVASEAIWDLANRDLPSPGTGSAWTTVDRLWYLSRGTAGAAFACTASGTFTSNGCNTGSWWKTMRAVDDDDGNLSNGTPHSCNLFAAFNRHGIACTTDAGANTCFRGCTPPAAPTLTLTPGNNSVTVGISGTGVFDVFRNELGCNNGFTKVVNDTSAASITDTGVANGTTYFYQVVAQPSGNEACGSAPSTCLSVVPDAGATPDFTIACSPTSVSVAQGGNGTTTCTVTSQNGFNSAVSLSCSGLPAGASCSFSPASVTPPSGGSASSTLTISATATATTGTSNISVTGASGATSHNASVSLTITPTAAPDFTIACSPTSLSAVQGGSASSTCTVTSQNGFNSAVSLSCSGLGAGVTCSFSPTSVTPPAGGSASSSLTVAVALTAVVGLDNFTVVGTSGATSHSANLSINVTAVGGPTVVFFDDFETDQGWTRNPNATDTATTGLWERGDPEQVTDTATAVVTQLGTTVSGVNDLVTARLAGASSGANDVDGGVTSIQSPAITLPSTGTLTLSFSSYFAHLNNSASDDFFRVRIVGSTTSTVLNIPGAATNVAAAFATTTANISSFAGQTIRILIDVADNGTGSLIEAAVDDVKITQTAGPTVVFSDDFETDQGWTRNPNATDTATTGLWERGDPEQVTDTATAVVTQLGTTPSGVNDLVTARLAGASAGANDVDGGVTSIQSPAITLPATGTLTLSFSSYFAHLNNSASDDFFRVRVVGATTSTVLNIPGAATNVAAAFTPTTADISSFAGQTIRILIDVADNGTGSLIEAAVDDVKITQQ